MGLTADRVKETTATTGTGSLTLAGAVTQFRSFNAAFGTNVFFYYTLIDGNGTGWESGMGYLSGATTLVRDHIDQSTNGGAAISLSANTHTVFSTATEGLLEDLTGQRYASARGYDFP